MGGFTLGGGGGGPIQIPYDKLLLTKESAQVPFGMASKISKYPYIEILNSKEDLGLIDVVANAVQMRYYIQYVKDIRHSHCIDSQDGTTYTVTGTTETDLLTIDYGALINAKYLYLILGLWTSASSTGYANVKISSDGSTWTTADSISTTSTSEVIFYRLPSVTSFRYLKFTGYNSAGYTTNLKARKVVVLYE